MAQNWQYNTPVPQPGALHGGGAFPTGSLRDVLDAKRSAQAPGIPSAAYPDGYLGTISSRREDRVLNAVKDKLNERSYQRGVHKGERAPAEDYFWPKDFNPMSGLERQASGKRWAPSGDPVEKLAHGGKNSVVTPSELGALAKKYGVSAYDPAARAETDPEFRQRMRQYLPTWR